MAKRLFDIVFSLAGLLLTFWLIVILYLLAAASTGQNGFFLQQRIGRFGKTFTIIKIRSMKNAPSGTYVTRFGRFIRKHKLDELPQLVNVLTGAMSFVGPRPDIAGYYDRLQGRDRDLLLLRPGITGPASLKYANEEALLAAAENPQKLNDEIIFPDKVRINLQYMQKRTLLLDIKILFSTVFGIRPKGF
jgi:lipopolysaccharide/colanic/teichoic acid biosynthesis glycosyltransferase